MSPSEQTGPQDRPTARPKPDPLAMTPGEKVAAEWEARHDVAARGRHGAPGAVQHYLAESRAREARGAGGHHTGATRAPHGDEPHQRTGRHSAVPAHESVPAEEQPVVPRARRRRRLFGRAG